MTNILRNALLCAVALSGLAGSAMAAQQMTRTECNTSAGEIWAGRCCSIHGANCLGGESHDRDHDRGRPT
jgi:hypothetical protein